MPKALKHILCIDDESDILEITKLSLETVGNFQVSTCSSGNQALDQATGINPDLILLDVMMPGLDGPSTFRQLKQQAALASIPIVFMTAKVQTKEIASYMELGAVGVIVKPFDPMQISAEITKIWDRIPERT